MEGQQGNQALARQYMRAFFALTQATEVLGEQGPECGPGAFEFWDCCDIHRGLKVLWSALNELSGKLDFIYSLHGIYPARSAKSYRLPHHETPTDDQIGAFDWLRKLDTASGINLLDDLIAQKARAKRATVLLAQADPDARLKLRLWLAFAGYDVLIVTEADDAIENLTNLSLIARTSPVVAIIDLHLDTVNDYGINGLEAVERAVELHIPCICTYVNLEVEKSEIPDVVKVIARDWEKEIVGAVEELARPTLQPLPY